MPKFYDMLPNETLDMDLDYTEKPIGHSHIFIGFPELDEDDPHNKEKYVSIIVDGSQIFPSFEEVDLIIEALETAKRKLSKRLEEND